MRRNSCKGPSWMSLPIGEKTHRSQAAHRTASGKEVFRSNLGENCFWDQILEVAGRVAVTP